MQMRRRERSAQGQLTDESHLRAILGTQNEIVEAGLDLDQVMERVVARARELTDADASVIEIAEGDKMVYRVAAGTAAHHVGVRLDRVGSLSGACVASGRTLTCDDAENDPRVEIDVCRRVGATSMICVPLRDADAVIGVLKVYSRRSHSFSAQHVETLDLLSHLVAAHMSNAARFEAARYESRHDPLTGLGNRRAFEERLEIEVAKSNRYGRSFAMCLMDLDGFKSVNDTFGHAAGDEVLRSVAAILRQTRGSDEVFRIGGDEFAWMMPETGSSGAERAAQRVAQQIADQALGDGRVTISFGIAEALGNDASGISESADAALYRMKRARSSPVPAGAGT
jgi:diguanylate cyclase (GGDEF)-like protein